jgi:4-hydroxysphinganine ceramide fatty acyl 2-hydroxylase
VTWRYRADWLIYPLVIAAFLFLMPIDMNWLWLVPAGFVWWTFVEYWVHRSLLHRWFWHGTHENHHKKPKEHVIFPVWYLPSIFLVLWLFHRLILGDWVWGFYTGFLLGWCWFMTMHHWLHHQEDMWPWLQRYAIWHNRHHKLNNCNYGITTPHWDKLFRTSK